MKQHCYKFNNEDFDENGRNNKNGLLFLDLLEEWESDFHVRNFPLFSNCLFASISTMRIIKNCLVVDPHEIFGIELIKGKIDINAFLEIEKNSKTIYAIGSRLDMNKPIVLVKEENITNGIILKWVNSDDLSFPK